MKTTEYALNAAGADKALAEIKSSIQPADTAILELEERETPYGVLNQIIFSKFITKEAYKRINEAIEGNIIKDFSEDDTSENENCINVNSVIQAMKKIQETGEISIPIDADSLPEELKAHVKPGITPRLTFKFKGHEK